MTGPLPDFPWMLLCAVSLAAPVLVLGQGGNWHAAVVAGLACLATPSAAIEAMLGLARLTIRIEDGARR
jgi:hypothetical protein